MKWRIYYSNLIYSGAVENAPERDVQVIVQSDPSVGWTMQHSTDYYIWEVDHWRGTDIFGLWDYLASPGWKKVLFGRTLTSDEFDKVYQRAKEARNFGNKTGFLPKERKPDFTPKN